MTLDIINGRADLAMFAVALLVGAWLFRDTTGILRLLFRLGGWAPWRPREMPTISAGWLAFLKWDGGVVALFAALVLIAHFLH
jgi:hypothetical protein